MRNLREQMRADLQLSGIKPKTQKDYLREVDNLANTFHRSLEELGEEELREYMLHLLNERHLSEGTFGFYAVALKFLYRTTPPTTTVYLHDGNVSFLWRDYADHNRQKTMTLKADEFIRRFLLHVLPPRYVRIRHYGLLANRNGKDAIALCRDILGDANAITKKDGRRETWQEQLYRICGIDIAKIE